MIRVNQLLTTIRTTGQGRQQLWREKSLKGQLGS